jgi:hypothetical protein
MLKEIYSALRYVFWDARVKRSFDAFLLMGAWLLTLALLAVSVPQSYDVIHPYEHEDAFKTWAMALASETAPALLLLIALHAAGLKRWQRWTLVALAAPFVLFTLHLQISYYRGKKDAPIEAIELGLVFPYGVIASVVAVAFLWPLVSKAKDDLAEKIKEAVAVEEARWRPIVEQKESAIDNLAKQLTEARHQLAGPDPERSRLERDSARLKELLESERLSHKMEVAALEKQLEESRGSVPVQSRLEFDRSRFAEILGAMFASGPRRINKETALDLIEQELSRDFGTIEEGKVA